MNDNCSIKPAKHKTGPKTWTQVAHLFSHTTFDPTLKQASMSSVNKDNKAFESLLLINLHPVLYQRFLKMMHNSIMIVRIVFFMHVMQCVSLKLIS